MRVSPAHRIPLAGATKAVFFTYLEESGGGHTWHGHCTSSGRRGERGVGGAARSAVAACGAGERGGHTERWRAPRLRPRAPHSLDTLAMKISAEPLSTGGGTQVARATAPRSHTCRKNSDTPRVLPKSPFISSCSHLPLANVHFRTQIYIFAMPVTMPRNMAQVIIGIVINSNHLNK